MKLISLKIKWFKNLDLWENPINFASSEGISVFVWNNGSGKSNILEAISAIFYGLYFDKNKLDFDFELQYSKDSKEIQISYTRTEWILHKKVNEKDQENIKKHLPSQIIALYSWEETRLWKAYYLNIYEEYIKSIIAKRAIVHERPPMMFIDKRLWSIALIVMLHFDVWLEMIIWNLKIDKINLTINKRNLERFHTKNPNLVTRIISVLWGITDLDLDKLKELQLIQEELFWILSIAYLPIQEKDRLIDSIELIFDNWITADELSEWQKKQILIYFVTQILADQNSIILLDEPDSYIHVGNKQRLKEFFTDFLESYNWEWEIIMTTHSPTLMHKFEKNHLFYLEDGKIAKKEKAEILEQIAWDIMSFAEQQIVLNTDKDILLVEWKFDIKYIETALSKISNPKYKSLIDIMFVPVWWASWLRLFIDKFTAKDNQKIIWILDGDQAWDDEMGVILNDSYRKKLEHDWFVQIVEFKNTFLLKLPRLSHITDEQYEIEDYFPLEKLVNISKNQIDTFKVLKNFTIKKDMIKRKLSDECGNYIESDFEWFKALFDLILEIKK